MKTTLKDVILLCKGWYYMNKYRTIFDALTAYYRQHYRIDAVTVTKRVLVSIVLREAMYELSEKYPDRLQEFVNGYIMPKSESSVLTYDEILFDRITAFFASMQLRSLDKSSKVKEIDVDEYFITNNGKLRLVEEIIK